MPWRTTSACKVRLSSRPGSWGGGRNVRGGAPELKVRLPFDQASAGSSTAGGAAPGGTGRKPPVDKPPPNPGLPPPAQPGATENPPAPPEPHAGQEFAPTGR